MIMLAATNPTPKAQSGRSREQDPAKRTPLAPAA